MPNILIEACVTSAQSALNAQAGGALRVELCDNFIEGGTTPSYATIRKARKSLKIDLFVMVRPRGGDFCYSDLEFEIMKEDIRMVKKLGANGIVAGMLLPDGNIDMVRMHLLKELAGNMEFTCHRAFDMTTDKFKAMEDLISIGVNRILTSGGKNKAPEGKWLIRQLVTLASDRIIIMPGSGVNEATIVEMRDATGAKEFHVTGRSLYPGKMQFKNPEVSMGGNPDVPEYETWETDPGRIRKIVELANS